MNKNIEGKVIVITGASSGLGEAAARHLSQQRAIAENTKKFYADIAIPADSFARVTAFAISQPEEMDINEILYRPTKQEY